MCGCERHYSNGNAPCTCRCPRHEAIRREMVANRSVTLDPENAEQMQQFSAAWDAAETSGPLPAQPMGCGALRMRAALHSLPNPKPDEPTGLGAVVEDADGKRYVRLNPSAAAEVADATRVWSDDGSTEIRYADIAAVKVLSSGVTA